MSALLERFFNAFSALSSIGRSHISKRGVLLVTSVGGFFALFITAVYMQRKRKSLPPPSSDEAEDRNSNVVARTKARHQKKRRKSRRIDVTSANAASYYRSVHRREHSAMSESSTVSSVKSSTSRHSKLHHFPTPGTKEFFEAEKFYRKGVDAFESALHQWEKAGAVLGNEASDVSSGRSTGFSYKGRSTPNNSQPPSPLPSRSPDSRSRTSLVKRRLSPASSPRSASPDYASGDWTVVEDDQPDFSSVSEIENKIFSFMERAEKLQRTFEEVLYSSGESETESDTDITLTGYDVDSDTASFVSAQEVWDNRSLDDYPSNMQSLQLYQCALEAVDMGRVRCRTMRTEMLECISDIEFLAKLHCVRQALDLMLEDSTVREWLISSGRDMIELILKSANRDTSQFIDAFNNLVEYVKNPESWIQIEDELKGRKVVSMTFYDIVLDFIIMDSFDDLDSPPSQLITVLSNRWLTSSIKESALSAAVWSVTKAKSRMLRYQDGFIAKFYAVTETLSPVFAWGFLGTDDRLKSDCEKFKSEVVSFLRNIFSFEKVRYTTKEQMSDDILNLARRKVQIVMAHFEAQR